MPQGSVLGPVLFIMYVNDITDNVKSSIKIFADDTKLYTPTSKSDVLQNDIDSIMNWAVKWEMNFNVDKCKVMHYGHANPQKQYVMNNKTLSDTQEECDLGVIFEKDLKFSKHISTKINKANSILGLINRSFEFLDEYTFVKLYTALIRPHVEFANVVWNPYLIKDISSLEKLQQRATKLVSSLKDLTYIDRLKKLKLPSLIHRRLRGDMIQTFKIVKGLDDCVFENFFSYSASTRGHNLKLEMPRSRTTHCLHQFSRRVIKTWNNLPKNVVDSKSVHEFKIKLDQHWTGDTPYKV